MPIVLRRSTQINWPPHCNAVAGGSRPRRPSRGPIASWRPELPPLSESPRTDHMRATLAGQTQTKQLSAAASALSPGVDQARAGPISTRLLGVINRLELAHRAMNTWIRSAAPGSDDSLRGVRLTVPGHSALVSDTSGPLAPAQDPAPTLESVPDQGRNVRPRPHRHRRSTVCFRPRLCGPPSLPLPNGTPRAHRHDALASARPACGLPLCADP